MNRFYLNSIVVLVLASVSVCAWADRDARMRPLPPNARSVDAPGEDVAAEATQTVVATPYGAMRLRADATSEAAGPDVEPPRVEFEKGPNGRVLRIVPGAQPDHGAANAAAASGLPEGAFMVELGDVKMVEMWNAAESLQAPEESAPVPAGMRIVDLPPGALAPDGMPEPMTLYRATTGPKDAKASPGLPESQ